MVHFWTVGGSSRRSGGGRLLRGIGPGGVGGVVRSCVVGIAGGCIACMLARAYGPGWKVVRPLLESRAGWGDNVR